MTDLTLEDLAASGGGSDDSGGSSSSSDESGGEWLVSLFDKLDERGYLDAYMAQQLDVDVPTEVEASGGGGDGDGSLEAGDVAQFGKHVIDEVGDVPISKVVRFAETNPETVNQLIGQTLNDETQE